MNGRAAKPDKVAWKSELYDFVLTIIPSRIVTDRTAFYSVEPSLISRFEERRSLSPSQATYRAF